MNPEEKIVLFVKRHMTSGHAGAHEFEHIKRVYGIAMKIGNKMGADLRILKPATLLHDIGRAKEETSEISHSILSGEMSEEILREVGYSDDEVQRVKAAIRTHRYSEGLRPTTLEGEILSDADKLDAMGAIGIFRAIAQATVKNAGIEGFLKHSDEKLLKLRELMYTDEAKKLAEKRHSVLASFVKELRNESEELFRTTFEV
ncbi:MAG: HD domain-containing protein [Candidatus Thorarchaeota archaeon]|nr:HD domain-containing protein [Candidatus Thorarchaeota archaeon]